MLSKNLTWILKTLHIIFGSIVFGGLVFTLFVFSLKMNDSLFFNAVNIDKILFHLLQGPAVIALWGLVFTSVIYSLFTSRGFLLSWWVISKWILFVVFILAFIFKILPIVIHMTALADSALMFSSARLEYFTLLNSGITWIILSLIMFIAAIYLAVRKPWEKRKRDLFLKRKYNIIFLVSLILIAFGYFMVNKILKDSIGGMEIKEVKVRPLKDGTYKGTFSGNGGFYNVNVEIEGPKIISIDYYTDVKSNYNRFADATIKRIIEKQSPNVDAITGATTTSKCIMKAVEDALIP